MTEQRSQTETVEVKIQLPKSVYDFLKAAHDFGKWKQPLEEYIADQVIFALEGDFGNLLEGLFSMTEIVSGYGLGGIIRHVDDC